MISINNGVSEDKQSNLKKSIKKTAALHMVILVLLILMCFFPWYHTEIRKGFFIGDMYEDYYLIKSEYKATRWDVAWDTYYSNYDEDGSDIKYIHYSCLTLVLLGILFSIIILAKLCLIWERWVPKKSQIKNTIVWSFILLALCWIMVVIYPSFMPDVLGDEWDEKEFYKFNSVKPDDSIHSNYPSAGWYFALEAALLSIGAVISAYSLLKEIKNRKGPKRHKRKKDNEKP